MNRRVFLFAVIGLCVQLSCSDDDTPGADAAPAGDAAPMVDGGDVVDTAPTADSSTDVAPRADAAPGVDAGPNDGAPKADAVDDGALAQDVGPTDLAPDTKCVPTSHTLAIVTPSGGSKCSFAFSKSFTPGEINLLLTPGWGTVCHAGSSSNCGSGASADGWWFSGGKINLCDATCQRFYKQTQAGKLTVRLGCPTEDCKH